MTMPTKRLIDEISQTAPKREIAGLIEALVFVRASRLILLQEAFCKEGGESGSGDVHRSRRADRGSVS